MQASDLGSQRLYHVTHVDNLERIIRDKQLFADTSADWDERPAVDVSPPRLRELRRSTPSGINDWPISDFVPFSLLPRNEVLELVDRVDELVVLVTGIDALLTWQRDIPKPHRPVTLFSDRNPTDESARFGRTREHLASLISHRQANGASSIQALQGIEFLIHDHVPFRYVSSLGVPTPAALTRAQALVATRVEPITVSIKPAWFGRARPTPLAAKGDGPRSV